MGNLAAIESLPSSRGKQKGSAVQITGDSEIKTLIEQAPLLDLIRADTGEDGYCSRRSY